ncbi:hypothetical protein [Pseudomonas chlororaphis]|uniref:hypothetical protein n=1 Tax=Pseudomonas chlororaphis TaxID=587753 RepID=UPI001FF0B3DC|nr:hypothetical protein [Pseudomonas chlororaphis]
MTQSVGGGRRVGAGTRGCVSRLGQFLSRLAPALLVGMALSVPTANANPITTYRGTLGDTPVELALTYDSQYGGGMSGYWFSGAERLPMPLELTPYRPDRGLLINIMDNPTLPAAAVSLQPFAEGAEALQGALVDLRTGVQQPLQLQRVMRFGGSQREAFDGELLQPAADQQFYFSVHAVRNAGEDTGRVDNIRVLSRATGEVVQEVGGQWCLAPTGTRTLTFEHFDADSTLDFQVQGYSLNGPYGSVLCAPTQYYLYHPQTQAYLRHPQLEQFAAEGTVRFAPGGQMEFSKQDFINFSAGIRRWDYYRVISPDRLEFIQSGEERF